MQVEIKYSSQFTTKKTRHSVWGQSVSDVEQSLYNYNHN